MTLFAIFVDDGRQEVPVMGQWPTCGAALAHLTTMNLPPGHSAFIHEFNDAVLVATHSVNMLTMTIANTYLVQQDS